MPTRRIYVVRTDDTQPKHFGAQNELLATVWLLKQGYDVFRNVSAWGLVDIVAMKDGELHKFDVKSASARRLSAEQHAINVKLLRVLHDGTCEIGPPPLSLVKAT